MACIWITYGLPLSERNLKNRIVAISKQKKGETYVPRISFETNISKQKKGRDLRPTY